MLAFRSSEARPGPGRGVICCRMHAQGVRQRCYPPCNARKPEQKDRAAVAMAESNRKKAPTLKWTKTTRTRPMAYIAAATSFSDNRAREHPSKDSDAMKFERRRRTPPAERGDEQVAWHTTSATSPWASSASEHLDPLVSSKHQGQSSRGTGGREVAGDGPVEVGLVSQCSQS